MNVSHFHWKNRFYPALAILMGLLLAHLIAMFQVYFSNLSLYIALKNIYRAGCLTVPNEHAMGRLQELTTAFYGGFFLTLSAGAGICLLSFAAAWAWDRLFFRKTNFLVLLLITWAGLVAGFNWNGFSIFESLYVLLPPPAVFACTLKWMPQANRKKSLKAFLLNSIPVILLGLLWAPQMKNDLFYNIRDHLLLKTSFGEKIVDLYYQYTLYPAEAIKPINRKLLKTFRFNGIEENIQYQKELRRLLLSHDWVETENYKNVDMIINCSVNKLSLANNKGVVLKIQKGAFLSHPGNVLEKISFLTDKKRFFRQFTFYALLFGLPLTAYIFLYSFFFFFVGKWPTPRVGAFLSSLLCFLTALLLILPLWMNNLNPVSQTVPGKKPANSMVNRTHEQLLDFLNAPSVRVVSVALSELVRRRDRKAIPKILRCIKNSEHWYIQHCAYKALKRLGWKQEKIAVYEKR